MSRRHVIDLFSPWREGPAALSDRHVGRERERDAIVSAARAFAKGVTPLPLYLFGGHGMGKSHLLTLAIQSVQSATPADEVAVTVLADDEVAMRSPERLFRTMLAGVERQPWKRWHEDGPPDRAWPRHVVVFEGLDRQLRALGVQGRRELRRLIGDGPPLWLIAAGMTLPAELTNADEAFFGAFDPWPLEPLDGAEAAALLDRVSGASEHDAVWRSLRRTLATLAGGNPRTLVALALAHRQTPGRPASELLHGVVHTFTPQYRARLRGLSPQAQTIITTMAAAPREMGPAELAERLGSSTTQMSVQARRLAEDGLLRHRSDGRQTWYRIADPLLRHWLEYRNARWSQTRVGWCASIVSALDEASQTAAVRARPTQPAATADWRAARRALLDTLEPTVDREAAERAIAEAAKIPAKKRGLRAVVEDALVYDLGDAVDRHLASRLSESHELAGLARLAELDGVLRGDQSSPRQAFSALLEDTSQFTASALRVLPHVLARGGHGRPWVLNKRERRALAKKHVIRALFLVQGRVWDHPPLIEAADVVAELEPDPPDAAELVGVATRLGHVELTRRAARALLSRDVVLPRCARPRVLDQETSDIVGELILRTLRHSGPPDGVGESPALPVRDALTWCACLTRMSEGMFESVVAELERERPIYGDYLHEVALASLLAHAPDRFATVKRASRDWGETLDQATTLVQQLDIKTRPNLYPELAVVADVVGEETLGQETRREETA